jgi:predicted DCC family thiol-disulfide oxidoreductase YuxK
MTNTPRSAPHSHGALVAGCGPAHSTDPIAEVGARCDHGIVRTSSAAFVYDGDCAFCSRCARFIVRRVPTPAQVRPWQHTDLIRLGLTPSQCDQAVQWVSVDRAGRRVCAAGPAAIAALLRSSGRFWHAVGAVLGTRPVLMVSWPVYRWVARHRDRMPGGAAACALPAAQRDPARHDQDRATHSSQ